MRRIRVLSILFIAIVFFGCDVRLPVVHMSDIFDEDEVVDITVPPPELQKDFYTKSVTADGMMIIGDDGVTDEHMRRARQVALVMTSKFPDMRDDLRYDKSGFYHALLGFYTKPCDIPERHRYCDVGGLFFWKLAFSKVFAYYPSHDMWMFCHETAHAIDLLYIRKKDPTFEKRLKEAYEVSEWAKGNDYRIENEKEYWADASTEWFFNVNHSGEELEKIMGPIITAFEMISVKEFVERDPNIAALLYEWYPPVSLIQERPADW